MADVTECVLRLNATHLVGLVEGAVEQRGQDVDLEKSRVEREGREDCSSDTPRPNGFSEGVLQNGLWDIAAQACDST